MVMLVLLRLRAFFFREDDYMESAAMELIASNNLPFSKCCATRKPLIWSMMACQMCLANAQIAGEVGNQNARDESVSIGILEEAG